MLTAMMAATAHASIAPYYFADRPASVQANPVVLALSIFGLLGGSLLALETIWRVGHKMTEERFPLHHPVTAFRWMVLMLAISILFYIGPDAVVFTSWPDVSPHTRRLIGVANRFCDFAALFPLAGAWLIGIYAQPTIDFQLRRNPVPLDLWPSWASLRRPLWIAFLVLLVSLILSVKR